MRTLRIIAMLAVAMLGVSALAQVDARLLREPNVSASHLAFIYAGDIWVAPKAGGLAQRLTTAKGEEHYPRFSPDGSLVAFTGDYDGNADVYVMPAMGGEPRRITHHPAPDRLLGWFPDGKSLLFASPMASGSGRFSQLYKVSVEGGLPERLPVPYGEFGAVSPDGSTLAYMPNSQDLRTWKRYRGGDVSRVYLYDLKTGAAKRVGDDGASYAQPMWHGSTLFVLSDRDANKRANIWAVDSSTGALRQLTFIADFDVKFPSAGPDSIVFEAGGRLYLLDLTTEKTREIAIQVVTDEAALHPRKAKVTDLVASADPSPSGKRVVFEARGEIFSVPAENGPTFNLTDTPGVAERYPAWSPDGKTLAYWTDRTGEYELALRDAEVTGAERLVTKLGPGFRYTPCWSPDSKKIVFADQSMTINLLDVATGAVAKLDHLLWGDQGGLEHFSASWSADSRWIAWSRGTENRQGAIFLHDTRTGKTSQATSAFYDDGLPAFDPEGQYLFYLTNRSFNPVYGQDNSWIYANMTQIAAVPLRADVASPLAPKNDTESEKDKADKDKAGKDKAAGSADKDGKQDKDKTSDKPKEKPKPVDIALDGFEARAVLLPPKPGNYVALAAVKGKILYRSVGLAGAPEDEKAPLKMYTLEDREEKTVLDDVKAFMVTAGGEKILVRIKDDWAFIEPKPDQKVEKKLDLSAMEMTVDPRAEWKQIFTDAWRFERDFFYDPNMHGVDWKGLRERYGKLIEQCATRSDVNFVLGELIAELNSSHTYRGGGDIEKPLERGVGLLGCDYAFDSGAYRIAHIITGAPWDAEARSPLAEPGVDVKEGDYLLAVNGVPLDARLDPWAALDGLAEKTVQLTVNARPERAGARTVLVKTLKSEGRLRNLAWVHENLLKVDKASGGKLGYIYVPDTGQEGQTELYRQFMAQFTKEGLVIDERWNSGGQIPDRFVELLNRPVTAYWAVRDGKDWQWPPYANGGPKVMLINGWSGSGGDCFPLFFRDAKLGPLVGRRTWGGLIGISGSPALVDGGEVTVPTFAIYSTEGKWIVEGHGVDPDIPVDDDPSLMSNGGDPQLERAIQEAMKSLAEKPPHVPARPAYEKR